MTFVDGDAAAAGAKESFLNLVRFDDYEAIETTLNSGDVDASSCSEALILSSQLGHFRIAHLLAEEGSPDLLLASPRGDTALHWAAQKGNLGLAKVLMSMGADINAEGDMGNRPVHLAASAGATEIVDRLLQEGAVVDTRNDFGNTPLMLAKGSECRALLQTVADGGDEARVALRKAASERGAAMKRKEEEENAATAEAKRLEDEAIAAGIARRSAEDAEEDRLEREEEERIREELEKQRQLEEKQRLLDEERRLAEEEAKRLADEAKKRKKKKGKKKK